MKANQREYLRSGKKFQKCKEDFICEHCGASVKGNGYTNHCPHCLWSKHVDINPGDRAASCGGMMRPVRIESQGKEMVIVHVCEKCGYEKRNKAKRGDDLCGWLSGKLN
ncbi:MAG: RNHCP domain-containing protein [bacterium]